MLHLQNVHKSYVMGNQSLAAENNVELIREGSAKRSGNVSNLVESTVEGMILSVGAIESEQFDAELEFISPKGEDDQGAVKFDIRTAITLKESSFLRTG